MARSTQAASDPAAVLQNTVEQRRKQAHLSLRTAAARAQISEATWRQLVAGGVMAGGNWVKRYPRRDQVLDMAHAVGVLDEVAELMDATPDEVRDTQRRVIVVDPAEEEIMNLRTLRPLEKLRLIESLNALRRESN